jgi:hypothetical protein
MSGLNKSQGQLVLADGSAMQATDADLGLSGKTVKGHINSAGGVTTGKAVTHLIGCGAGGGGTLAGGGNNTPLTWEGHEVFNALLGTTGDPNRFVFRADGKIKVPEAGEFKFHVRHDDDVWVWIDANRNGKVDGGEAKTRNGWSRTQYINNWLTITLPKEEVKFAIVLYEHGGGNHVNLRMTGPGSPGTEDVAGTGVRTKAKKGDIGAFNAARNANGGW